jgi:CO/xanthine dehydrogenase FAD-binding subunit
MLALDAKLETQPDDEKLGYGEVLVLRSDKLRGRLITKIIFSTQPKLSYHLVSRTPADLPIVSIALAQWPSVRTRLAVGGFGATSRLALDGRDNSGLAEALENAIAEAGDQWASAEYRLDAGRALLTRAVAELQS